MDDQKKFVWSLLSDKIRSVLNIGYRFDSDLTIQKSLESKNIRFCVLEAWEENCRRMMHDHVCNDVYHGDCRYIEDVIEENFDAILWLHGPEHVKWEDFLRIRHLIENKANQIVIYQMPLGEYHQGAIYGNPYEVHLQTLTPDMFQKLNYQVHLTAVDAFTAYRML
jgi:hypothetical protein